MNKYIKITNYYDYTGGIYKHNKKENNFYYVCGPHPYKNEIKLAHYFSEKQFKIIKYCKKCGGEKKCDDLKVSRKNKK